MKFGLEVKLKECDSKSCQGASRFWYGLPGLCLRSALGHRDVRDQLLPEPTWRAIGLPKHLLPDPGSILERFLLVAKR